MTFQQIDQSFPTLSGDARVAGVIGWPIAHSLSPRLHGFWLNVYGVNGGYIPLPVRPENLADVLTHFSKFGLRGVNVTLPHKENALTLVDRVTPAARQIGAVNTIVVDTEGGLIGSNTDSFGFIEALREGAPTWRAASGPAVVLGAGGAARAIVFALLHEGVPEVRLINRTLSTAAAMAAQFGGPIRVLPWIDREPALAGATLLVNTTSLGMRGKPSLDIELAALPVGAVVNDIVYAPLETDLLRAARARGNRTVDGLGMLMHQARPGFAAWFGRMPEVTAELRSYLLRHAQLK